MLTFDELFAEGIKARKLSYSPYSNFEVGAVLECKDGTLIYGANIENCAYGLSMCAERNAIFQGYLKGYRPGDYAQLLIVADSEDITSPCGSCRQVLSELMGMDTPVYCANLNKKYIKTTIGELLPYGFSKDNLEK